jgi:hypothetical protein
MFVAAELEAQESIPWVGGVNIPLAACIKDREILCVRGIGHKKVDQISATIFCYRSGKNSAWSPDLGVGETPLFTDLDD